MTTTSFNPDGAGCSKPLRTDYSERDDAELVDATRQGDTDAYGELWLRHRRAALAIARSLSMNLADDLVADAYMRILRVLQSGKGPTDNFRAYLSTAIRTSFIDGYRKDQRSVPVGDDEVLENLGAPVRATYDDETGQTAFASSAWRRLNPHDRLLVWATAVEGYGTTELACALGIKPNTAAVWTYRAREKLRTAYLGECVERSDTPICQRLRDLFAAHARGRLAPSRAGEIGAHLDECAECRDEYDRVARMSRRMRSGGFARRVRHDPARLTRP